MNQEDAVALLTVLQLDQAPPPPIDPERMAALFAAVMSDDPPDGLNLNRRCARRPDERLWRRRKEE
jgi:hypothetical protein